jgi:nickel superoxide dismutase
MSLATRIIGLLDRIHAPRPVHAHCDTPCGIYDPELARIEAESALRAIEKYHDSDDEVFRQRCIFIKEERTHIAKHHLSILWSDYFKPEHLDYNPELHDLFWRTLKQCSKVKASADAEDAKELLRLIDEVDQAWIASGGPGKTRVNGRPGQ